MAYEGELLDYCPARGFDFSRAYAVIVSGARLNPYGHMLLNTGGRGGNYFHVSDVVGTPRMMNEEQFQRYLRENGKIIVSVLRKAVPRPADSQRALENLLSRKWIWLAVIHNCETMVEDILVAGGAARVQHGRLPLPMQATNQCLGW